MVHIRALRNYVSFEYQHNLHFWRCLFAYYLYQNVSIAVVTIFRVSLDKSTINILTTYTVYRMCIQVYNLIQYGEKLWKDINWHKIRKP